MKQYLITIQSYIPYPVKKEFRIDGSSMATASARAIRKYRKEVGKKKISDLSLTIQTIGKITRVVDLDNTVAIPQILLH